MPEPLLEVRDLRVAFRTRRGTVTAVDGLSFSIEAGEALGVVGESGSGKSVTVLSLLRLIRDPNAQISGSAVFRGEDLLRMPASQLRGIRGRDISMIFQDSMTALTPVYPIGWHIAEQLRAHEPMSRRAARARSVAAAAGGRHTRPGRARGQLPPSALRRHAPTRVHRDGAGGQPRDCSSPTSRRRRWTSPRRRRFSSSCASSAPPTARPSCSSPTTWASSPQIADRVLVMYGGRAVERGASDRRLPAAEAPVHLGAARTRCRG